MSEHRELIAGFSKTDELHFQEFPRYARFLLDQVESLADEMLRIAREVKLPLLAYFDNVPEEQIKELSIIGTREYLLRLMDNRASDYIECSLERFLSNIMPVVSRDQVVSDDITLSCYIRKKALLKFLPDFTSDIHKHNRIIAEIDTFILHLELSSLKAFTALQQKNITDYSHFIEKINKTTPGLLYIFDLVELKEVYVNLRVKEYLGYSHSELQNMGGSILSNIIHPDDIPKILAKVKDFATAADQEIRAHEFRAKAKDGSIYWFRSFESVFKRDADGLPVQVIGNALDITAEKEAIAQLKKHERQMLEAKDLYEQAQQITHIGNWVWEINENKVLWSDELYRIYGLEPQSENITFEYAISLVHPDDREMVNHKIQRSLETGRYSGFYHRILLEDGIVKTLHAKGEVLMDDEGRPYKMVGTGQDVSERQNLIERLLNSEELSKQAEALTHIGNWTWDIINNKVTWSDELYHIYGLEPQSEQITFERFQAFMHPNDREKRLQQIQQSLQTLHSPDYILRIVLDNGAEKVLRGRGKVIADKAGKAVKLVGTCQDITEQKRLEDKLDERERNLRNLIYNAPDPVIVIDNQGQIILWNPQAETVFGWRADETEGTALMENIIPLQHRKSYDEEMKRLHATGDMPILNKSIEITALNKSGEEFDVSLTISRTIQRRKSAYIAFVRDISEKKKAETALNESKKKLEELYKKLEQNYTELENSYTELIHVRKQLADDRTRFIINTMPHIVASAAPDGFLDYANKHLMDFTGLSFEELKGWGWARCIYPDDLERLTNSWKESLKTGKPLNMEFRLVNAAGEPFWHLAEVLPHYDEKGSITMWIATITNIHDHKVIEEKKDEFIGIASHELKTPLTSAKAYLQLLQSQLAESGNTESALYVNKANTSINRLNELISELLDISKIQHGKLPFKFAEFDFNELLDDTIELIQETSPKYVIKRSGQVSRPVTGDKERLRQVCINLLTNAVKYSPKADLVDVVVTDEQDEVSIAVVDYGIGIPQSDLEKIFGRFYRVNGVGAQYQGLGIGLFITAEIIQRHHGKIWVTSEPGKGSTFHFKIPFKAA